MSTSRQRFLELDSLRGMAACAVVVHHVIHAYDREYGHQAGMILTGVEFGVFGVDLFFMISGFVIYWSLAHTSSVWDYARARFVRLYPTYWACVLLTFAVVSLVPAPARLLTDFKPWHFSLHDVGVNLLMFQEAFCWPRIEGLCVRTVDPVYWTLWFEFRFYVFMGLFFVLGWTRRPVRLLTGVITMVIALNLLNTLNVVPGAYVNFLAYVTLYQYALLFMMGAATYLMWSGRVSTGTAAALIAYAVAGVFLLGGVAYGIKISLVFGGLLTVVLVRPTFLRSRVLVFLGTISFALYLVHSSISYLINAYVYDWGWNGYIGVAVSFAVALGLGTLVTFLVERPAHRLLRPRPPKSDSVEAGAALQAAPSEAS